jgi:hypothetical protein
MTEYATRTGRPSRRFDASWNATRKPGIGGNHPPKPPGSSSPRSSSTTPPVPSTATPRRSSIPTLSSSMSPSARTDRPARFQERGYFDSQQFATAVYQSELTYRLRNLGYEIEPVRSGAPEIKGYTQEYLDASSHAAIRYASMEKHGLHGYEAAEIARTATRDKNSSVARRGACRPSAACRRVR